MIMFSKLLRLALVLTAWCGLAIPAEAQKTGEHGHAQLGFELFGTTYDGKLYTLNTQTGASTLVSQPAARLGSLTYDSRQDLLYATSDSGLLAINPHTFQTTVMATGVTGISLTYQQSTGMLYTMSRPDLTNNDIYLTTINPTTGVQTNLVLLVNQLTRPDGWSGQWEVHFDPRCLLSHPHNETFYLSWNYAGTDRSGVLSAVDPKTGAATTISGFPTADAITINPSTGLYYVLFPEPQGGPFHYLVWFDPVTVRSGYVGGSYETAKTIVGTGLAFAPHYPGWRD